MTTRLHSSFLRLCSCLTLLLACCCNSTSIASACSPQEPTDQSQRFLPFPEQQTATPSVHAELLRRLRDALQQSRPDPPQSHPAEQPPAIPPQDLLDLSKSLQNLADRIPPGLLPRGLSEIPPQQLEKSLQHPDTQQSLRQLLEQFRREGLLPPPDDNSPPTPAPDLRQGNPPRQSNPDRDRNPNRDGNPPRQGNPNRITPQPGTIPPSSRQPPMPLPQQQPEPPAQQQQQQQPLPPKQPPQPQQPPQPPPPDQRQQPQGPRQPQKPEPQQPQNAGDNPAETPATGLSRDALRRLEDFYNELRKNSDSSVAPISPPAPAPTPSAPLTEAPPEAPQNPPQTNRRPPLRRRDRPQQGTPPAQSRPGSEPAFRSETPATPEPDSRLNSQSTPAPDTARTRSLFESLNQIFEQLQQQPPSQDPPPSPNDQLRNPEAAPSVPTPDQPSQPPFSIPDFLRQQLQDPQLRNRADSEPSSPQSQERPDPERSITDQANSSPTPDLTPTPTPTPNLRSRPPVSLDPGQSFRDSFRQLLNEAREEARQTSPGDQPTDETTAPQNAGRTPSEARPQTPSPPSPPAPGPGRAESLLRMLDELAQTPDRRQGQSGLRPQPQPRITDSTPLPEPPRSLLDNLLGGSPPAAPEPPAAANPPSPRDPAAPTDSASPGPDLSATPSAFSVGATLAVALAVLWLLLKFADKQRQQSVGSAARERPLPPEQIQGRPDIVAAYHQLARRAGRSFRPWWHHRQIETLLLQTLPGRHAAITRLARVYEQSRYAPDSIPLTPTDLQTAREAIRECQHQAATR